jgi:urease accessory protein
MTRGTLVARLSAASFLSLAATPAFAHHVMDGKAPTTFVEGLLSGLGHPVIEPAHLAAIILAGIVAARLQGGFGLVAAFVAGGFFGTIAASAATLAIDETFVVASVAVLALLLPFRGSFGWLGAFVFLAIGVVHGVAFAESVIGAETQVVGAYLLGLALTEMVIAGAFYWATSRLTAGRTRA